MYQPTIHAYPLVQALIHYHLHEVPHYPQDLWFKDVQLAHKLKQL